MHPIRPLTNFDLNAYFGKQVTYSRDNLPKIKNDFYIINLDDESSTGTHWVVVYNVREICFHFDSYGVKPAEEVIQFMRKAKKGIVYNIYRVQALNSYLCGYFCVNFVNSMNSGMKYKDWLLLYDPRRFQKNDILVKKNLKL